MDKIQVSMEGISAVIFDLNGTMIDDGTYHYLAFEELCRRHDIPFSREIYAEKASSRVNRDIMPALVGHPLSPEENTALAEEKEQIYLDLYQEKMGAVPGLVEIVEQARTNGLKIAVATNFVSKYVHIALKQLRMEQSFDAVVSGDQVERCKPDPEIYLKAAALLGVTPEQCLVFEDSLIGVRAARAARMRVLGITTGLSAETLQKEGAEMAAPDFTHYSL